MFMKKGQSILEYAILLAVVIAVLLIMQAFVKRGYQGSLKNSANSMGEQFSAGGTTIKEQQAMAGDQDVTTEVGTTSAIMSQFSGQVPSGVNVQGTIDKSAYSLNTRVGGTVTAETQSKTDPARIEKARIIDYPDAPVVNLDDPNLQF